jgi:NAD(P)-dependent dehydrogenase (short-subunit alcohol dehydrogenase family)
MADPRAVLVAGGTRGIGRAIGLAFARTGARVVLTHRWGSVDPAELAAEFAAAGAAAPEVVEADVGEAADTRRLLEHIGPPGVDVFVAAVCVVGKGDGTLAARTLRRSLSYSAWPVRAYVEAMAEAWGAPPRYTIALSSDGADHFYPGYDYVAASKAVLEALCRRLAERHPTARINALRARQVDTTGYREMFGEDARARIARFALFDLTPDEVAQAALALAGGDLDGLSGEVVTIDHGAAALDNLVNVAPVLMGAAAPWEAAPRTDRAASPRPGGVLWVDAGVAPGPSTLPGPLRVVDPGTAAGLPGADIPDRVVLGCDWTARPDDDTAPAELLLELLDRAAAAGGTPRYGVRVERGAEPPAPGEALARALDRYWGSWRAGGCTRVNAVRYTEAGHHAQAVGAVRALLSGALDGMRGQVLNVARGAVA